VAVFCLFEKKNQMRHLFILGTLLTVVLSCTSDPKLRDYSLGSVEITSILEDSTLSIRALELGSEYLYYGSSDHLGKIALDKEVKLSLKPLKLTSNVNRYKNVITYEDKPLHFRAIEAVRGDLLAISIGSPARLYLIPRKSNQPELVYEEAHESVFYDAMAFWNDKEGLAIGDPTDGCISIIITRDGGRSWDKMNCGDLPPALEGEAAFAASDTNISIVGDKTWVATGGKVSRVLFSGDRGRTWEVTEVPITQGEATTGLYSLDFYDEDLGYGIGGDYTRPNENTDNKIITRDGGKTWEKVASGKLPGYRSCVQFIPNSEGTELVAVGFKGIDYSMDSGRSWTHLSDEGFYTIRFVNDTVAYAGGKGRLSKLTFRK
jgi:photosystem II stability/assembly factor-like uncharacterized protein